MVDGVCIAVQIAFHKLILQMCALLIIRIIVISMSYITIIFMFIIIFIVVGIVLLLLIPIIIIIIACTIPLYSLLEWLEHILSC